MAKDCTKIHKRSTKANKNNSHKDEIPNDLLLYIFSWLPAKSIGQYRTCAKFINKSTRKPFYLKQHYDNSLIKGDTCFFIQPRKSSIGSSNKIEIHPLPGENASTCGVNPRFLQFLKTHSVRILISTNGLLLFETPAKDYSMLFICNPATLSFSFVTTLRDNASMEFVLECNSKESKVIAFKNNFQASLGFGCSIFDPKTDSWNERERSFFIGDWMMNYPIFHKGIIHVVVVKGRTNQTVEIYIATYNIESGISSVLDVPEESKEIHPHDPNKDIEVRIFKWGKVGSSDESICLIRMYERCDFTIWVLKDYKSNCWRKFIKVSLKEMGLKRRGLSVVDFIVMNENLVFGTLNKVFCYDLWGLKKTRLQKVCVHELGWDLSFIPYWSTFRSSGSRGTNMRGVLDIIKVNNMHKMF